MSERRARAALRLFHQISRWLPLRALHRGRGQRGRRSSRSARRRYALTRTFAARAGRTGDAGRSGLGDAVAHLSLAAGGDAFPRGEHFAGRIGHALAGGGIALLVPAARACKAVAFAAAPSGCAGKGRSGFGAGACPRKVARIALRPGLHEVDGRASFGALTDSAAAGSITGYYRFRDWSPRGCGLRCRCRRSPLWSGWR